MTVDDVARQVGVSRRTLHCWLALDRSGASLEDRKDGGRQTGLSSVAKLVLAKAVLE